DATQRRLSFPRFPPKSTPSCRRRVETMSMIEAFVVDMRHELRTPVNAILGYSELLIEGQGGASRGEARHDLERVIDAGHQLLRIVTEALDAQTGDDVAVCAAR